MVETKIHSWGPRSIALLTFGLSFCSFSYHLLVANVLALLTGGSTKWHSLTVGVYLLGVGLGTMYAERLRIENVGAKLFHLEWRLALLGSFSAMAVLALHIVYRLWFQSEVMVLFGEQPAYAGALYDSARALPWLAFIGAALTLVAALGLLTGQELPLLSRLGESQGYQPLLSWNYFGTVVSGLLIALWIVPQFDVVFACLIIGTINGGIVLWLWWRQGGLRQPWRRFKIQQALSILLVGGSLVIGYRVYAPLHQTQLQTFYHFRHGAMAAGSSWLDSLKAVQSKAPVSHRRSLYQAIDVTSIQWPHTPAVPTLFLNGHFQFDTRQERFYHEVMAHGGAFLAGQIPRRVLVLGAGDGLLVRELLKHGDQIETITVVELDPAVVELMDQEASLRGLNENSLADPKVRVLHQDAVSFVRKSPLKFDGVYIDFPFPSNYDLAKLYSVEFYRLIRRRLATGGFIMASAPVYQQPPADQTLSAFQKSLNNILFSTLHAAGYEDRLGVALYGDAFVFARAKQAPNIGIDLPARLYALRPEHLALVRDIQFPHTIDKKFVHSIFRPRLLGLDNPTL